MQLSRTTVADDGAAWAAVIQENLAPRELWPILTRVGDRPLATPLNLAQELLAAADASPRKIALVSRNESVSYRTLRDRVLIAAGVLTRLGVQPTDRVAFRFANTLDFVVTWLAVQWVGAIGVPIPAIYRVREIAHIVNHSGASLIIASPDLAADITAAAPRFVIGGIRIVTTTNEEIRVPADPLRPGLDTVPPPPHPTPDDAPALITYITGAMGALKGVVHSPAEILATADTYARDILDLTSRDVCIGLPPMAWSFGLGALLVFPFRVGATSVLPENSGPPFPSLVAEHRATVIFSAPTMYRMLLRQPDLESFDWTSVRRCVSAAEPLPAAVVDEWRARTGLDLLDGLGTTELAHIFISSRPGAVRPSSMGQAVAGYAARIVDVDGREMPAGVPGLLAIQGPTGARYWRDVEAQRLAVRDGWTLTGDICSRDASGWFTHVSRADDLIVCGGYKVSPAEVERALLENCDVMSARVFAAADAVRGAVPHAEISLQPHVDPAGAVERLQRYLKRELAPYKCPRTIELRS